jgi:hypothetical protein
VPAPGDYDDGEIGGMMIGKGNRSTQRKPAPVPLCPPQTPHAVRTRTRAAAEVQPAINCLSYGTAFGTLFISVNPGRLIFKHSYIFQINIILNFSNNYMMTSGWRYNSTPLVRD